MQSMCIMRALTDMAQLFAFCVCKTFSVMKMQFSTTGLAHNSTTIQQSQGHISTTLSGIKQKGLKPQLLS